MIESYMNTRNNPVYVKSKRRNEVELAFIDLRNLTLSQENEFTSKGK